MLAKPINLLLVYIVTIFNIAILASPLIAIIVPIITRFNLTNNHEILVKLKLAIFILLFCVGFLTTIYMLFDFLFGFAMRFSLKNCKRYEKIKDYDFLSKIFSEVKDKFNEKSVKLYIKESDEINAFAVSSLGGKAIILSSGLVNHYLSESSNPKEFLYAIRSIMAHEMSHLINKDFLPTFLVIANQKVTNFISYILDIAFSLIIRISSYTPYIGIKIANLSSKINDLLQFLINAFNRFVVYNIYEFLRKFISRSIEYRCDKQSAEAFGGKNMAFALSFLGESGYFTLFSTHPSTQKRMKKVENIELKDGVIGPKFIDSLSNYFALSLIPISCIYFAKEAKIDYLLKIYIQNHDSIHGKIKILWNLFNNFI